MLRCGDFEHGTIRDASHLHWFLQHSTEVAFFQMDGAQMNQARSDKDHPLRIAGLLDRAFAARDLLDAVDAVERLIENAHPLLPGDDHA